MEGTKTPTHLLEVRDLRKRFGAQVGKVKSVANQLVAAETAFKSLPISAQISARTLADRLMSISNHLAGAAEYGAATAHRLSGIAHNKVAEIEANMAHAAASFLERRPGNGDPERRAMRGFLLGRGVDAMVRAAALAHPAWLADEAFVAELATLVRSYVAALTAPAAGG